MCFVTTSSFAIFINDVASSFFRPNMGLEQGFPLSPYIFLLVEEEMIRSIVEARRVRSIQGV